MLDDGLIAEIRDNPKVIKYLDIPLQHVSDSLLRKMNRRSDSKSIKTLFDKLQKRGIAVRSTFICGFPGETDETIEELQSFLREYKLRNVGFFAYSREEGTVAYKLENQVSERKKQKYVKECYKCQHAIAEELNKAEIGKIYECIVDEFTQYDGQYYFYKGRNYYMTPEIDGAVYIASKYKLETGNFYKVRINGALEYDLSGDIAE